MSESKNPKIELQIKMMRYVIRDEDTDEIVGLRKDAPEDVKKYYKEYMKRLNSKKPIVKS